MKTVLDAFREAGLELEEFEVENGRLYQYDGYDHGNSILVQLRIGMNKSNSRAIFGEYHAEDGSVSSLSGPLRDWMEEFGVFLPLMAAGQPLPF